MKITLDLGPHDRDDLGPITLTAEESELGMSRTETYTDEETCVKLLVITDLILDAIGMENETGSSIRITKVIPGNN